VISYPTWALVRDIVRAAERGSIAAKGIRREVGVFAVPAFLTIAIPHPSPALNRRAFSCLTHRLDRASAYFKSSR